MATELAEALDRIAELERLVMAMAEKIALMSWHLSRVAERTREK
jgi:hypothetical protein